MYSKINDNENTFKAFIRGLFLSAGSCIIPGKNESHAKYHLEIYFSSYESAFDTSKKLEEYGIKTKIVSRREGHILYIKSAEDIKDFVAFLPAPISVLKLTDLIIEREIKNESNRRKNCDLANVNKQVEASGKQIEAIKKIQAVLGLDKLKDDLRTVAVARMENPEETLLELAESLSISKSCLNHRLRRIVSLAGEL